jgi:hypothetical protein
MNFFRNRAISLLKACQLLTTQNTQLYLYMYVTKLKKFFFFSLHKIVDAAHYIIQHVHCAHLEIVCVHASIVHPTYSI